MNRLDPKLALAGGTPVIQHAFTASNPIKDREILAAETVLKSGRLSAFLGAKSDQFLGGPRVKEFEAGAKKLFGTEYCISFNSWTSGLESAIAALPDLELGDEIITTSWTMSATASAILINGYVPVFADIDPGTFCIDPKSVESLITPNTRAILTVDIFGRSSNYTSLRAISEKYNLWLIGDSAQSPGTLYEGNHVASLSDIGGYSLNYHKHLHSGEGGFAVTDSNELASRLQLIRNHAESVVEVGENNSELIGHNFRLGEIEAAIANVQLERLDDLINPKIVSAEYLTDCLAGIDELITPSKLGYHENVYYIYPILLRNPGVKMRNTFVEALKAEGVPAVVSHYQNIHRLPIYESFKENNRGRYSHLNFSQIALNSYGKGSLPVAEHFYDESFLGIHMCSFDFTRKDIEEISEAIRKVAQGIRVE
jgi:perosamine synthetase